MFVHICRSYNPSWLPDDQRTNATVNAAIDDNIENHSTGLFAAKNNSSFGGLVINWFPVLSGMTHATKRLKEIINLLAIGV